MPVVDVTMAANARAIVILHITVILVTLSAQSTGPEILEDIRRALDPCGSYLSEKCAKHFGFGQGVLYETLLSPTVSKHIKVKVGTGYLVNNNKPNINGVMMSLLLSVDIHQCPAPVAGKLKRQAKFPCTCYEVGARSNSKALSCHEWDRWTHIRCYYFPAVQYEPMKTSGADIPFICPSCCLSAVPRWVDDSEATDAANLQDTDPPTEAVTSPQAKEMDGAAEPRGGQR